MAKVITKALSRRAARPKRLPRPMTFPYTRVTSFQRRFPRYTKQQEAMSTAPTVNYNPAQVFTYVSSRTGTALTRWRQVIRDGGNATTSFNAFEDTIEGKFPMMDATYRYRPNPSVAYELRQSLDSSFANWFTKSPLGTHFSSAADAEAESRAVKELYAKVRRAHHQLQGGVILGEIDKTARLLTGTARRLKQGLFSYLSKAVGIRRGKGTGSSKQKAIANTYLEATFGWQPLIGDCKDLAKTLGRLTHEVDRVRFRAGAEKAVQTSSQNIEVSFWFLYLQLQILESTRCNVVYRGFLQGLPYEIGSPPLERIVSMSGFDLRSFIPTMWELVPYSFVVDYFTNIGDCLYALSTDTSIVKQLWRTQLKESTREYRATPNIAKSKLAIETSGSDVKNVLVTGQGGSVAIKRRDITRNVTSMPFLLPRLTGVDLPWRQFANIGALITGKTAR